MILLKSIYTLLKRTSFFFLLPLSLYAAAPFSVSVVSSSPYYGEMLKDSITELSGEIENEGIIEDFNEKRREREKVEEDRIMSELLLKENIGEWESFKRREAEREEDLYLVLAEDVSITEEQSSFLLSGDPYANSYFLLYENIDMILSLDAQDEGQFSVLTLYKDGDVLAKRAFLAGEDVYSWILSSLLPLFKGEEYSLVSFSLPSAVTAKIDGRAVSNGRNSAVVRKGEHTFTYTSPGYKEKSETVLIEGYTVLEPLLEKKESSTLFVSTRPYDADIFFLGEKAEVGKISGVIAPFSITATAEGFSSTTFQISDERKLIEIDLKPIWMESENLIESAKKRFYNNLLTTLLSFGTYVAFSSLSSIYAQQSLQITSTFFAGFSIVSLVTLVDSMFDYYRAAMLGL